MPRRISSAEAAALLAAGEAEEVEPRRVSAAEAARLVAAGEAEEVEPARPPEAEAPPPSGPGWFAPGSASGAVVRGFGQGAGLGFIDEARGVAAALREAKARGGLVGAAGIATEAAIGPIMQLANAPMLMEPPTGRPLLSAYMADRDAARHEDAVARRAHPGTYFASEMAGMATLPLPKAKPLTTVGARAGQYAKAGGVLGGAMAAGGTETPVVAEDGVSAQGVLAATGEAARGVGIGAAAAGVLGPAVEVGAERFVRPVAKRLSETLAAKHILGYAGISDRLARIIGAKKPTPAQIREVGAQALATGTIKPFAKAEGTLERVLEKQGAAGANIGQFLDDADKAVARGAALPASRDVQAQRVSDALRSAGERSDVAAAQAPGVARKLLKSVRPKEHPFGPLAEGEMRAPPATYESLWRTKSDLQGALRPMQMSRVGDDLYRQGVSGYTQGLYTQLESALGPAAGDALRGEAAQFGKLEKMRQLLTPEVQREMSRVPVGLGAQNAMQTAATVAGAPGAATSLIQSLLMRGRYSSTGATAARALSRNPGRAVGQVGAPYAAREAARPQQSKEERDAAAAAAFTDGN